MMQLTQIMQEVNLKEKKKFQKIVEINAGAALYLVGMAKNIKEGSEIVAKTIDEGKTKNFITKMLINIRDIF